MMRELVFVAPDASMRRAIESYRQEHFAYGEQHIYGGAWMEQVPDFSEWLHIVRANADERSVSRSWVVSTTLCVLRKADGYLVGMVDIHHALNDFLKTAGGHLSYGVRPSQRGRGYGTQILNMALEELARLDVKRVMINCDAANLPAIRTIEKNGGVPSGEFEGVGGRRMIRFRMQPQTPAQPKPNAAPELFLKDGRRVTIRSAEEKDAHALAALFRRTERESVYLSREPDELRISAKDAEATIRQVNAAPKRLWLVAEAEGDDRIIARCSVNYFHRRERFQHCASIEIEILRAYWNQGIGSMMIDLALGWAYEKGFEQAQVYINAADVRTIHVFEKFGFRIVGRIPNACRYPDATYADMLLLYMKL